MVNKPMNVFGNLLKDELRQSVEAINADQSMLYQRLSNVSDIPEHELSELNGYKLGALARKYNVW